jgi:hypothetical protein
MHLSSIGCWASVIAQQPTNPTMVMVLFVICWLLPVWGESVAEWSRSRTHNSDVVGSRPGVAEIF